MPSEECEIYNEKGKNMLLNTNLKTFWHSYFFQIFTRSEGGLINTAKNTENKFCSL